MENRIESLIRWTIITFLLLLPLAFNPLGYNIYPFAKVYLLYTITATTFLMSIILLLIRGSFVLPRIAKMVIGYICVLIVGTLLSVHPKTAIFGEFTRFEGLITWLCYFWMAFLGYSYIDTLLWRKRMVFALTIGLGITSIYGLLQSAGFDALNFQKPWADSTVREIRAFSTIGNPSTFGAYLVLVLPLAATLALRCFKNQKFKNTVIFATISMLGTGALLATYSRGAWLGFAGALLCLAIAVAIATMLGRKENKLSTINEVVKYAGILGVVVLVIGCATIALSPSVKTRALSIFDPSGGNSSGRVLLWKQSFSLIAERPLFGWGLDAFQIAFPKYVIDNWDQRYSASSDPITRENVVKSILITDNAHNLFLHNAVTSGLLGLAALIGILMAYFMTTSKVIAAGYMQIRDQTINSEAHNRIDQKNDQNGAQGTEPQELFTSHDLLLATSLGMLAYLIALQFHFSTVHVSPIFWIFFGMGVKLAEKNSRNAQGRIQDDNQDHAQDYRNHQGHIEFHLSIKPISAASAKRLFWLASGVSITLSILMLSPIVADVELRSGVEALNSNNIREGVAHLSAAENLHPWEEEYTLAKLRNLTFVLESNQDKSLLDVANKALARAEALNPVDANLFFYKGDLLFADGEITKDVGSFVKAARAYETLVKLDPGFAKGRLRLGACYFATKEYEKAIQQWSIAAAVTPDSPNPLVNIAYAYEKMGRPREARRYYKRVLAIDRGNQRAQEGYNRTSRR